MYKNILENPLKRGRRIAILEIHSKKAMRLIINL